MASDIANIFLADDDEDDCIFFQDALSELKFDVRLVVAKDGMQAMDILYQQSPLPDIIFLDLNMPLKNGFECLAEIKNDQKLTHMPVVIFSTSAQPMAIERAYQDGAWLYLRKPKTFNSLKAALKVIFEMKMTGNITQPSKEEFLIHT